MRRLFIATMGLVAVGCADILGAEFDDLQPAAGGDMALVPGERRPGDLAADATHVYYVVDELGSADGIWRVEQAGGANELVYAGEAPIEHLAVDATHVYFTEEHWVKKLPKAGGSVVELFGGDAFDHIQGVALGAGAVYWTNRNGGHGAIRSVAIGGGDVAELVMMDTDPVGIAVNATVVIWASSQSHEVMSTPLGGGEGTPLASGAGSPREVAINATHVCFSQRDGVASVGLDGDGYAFRASAGEIHGVAASATRCYFGSSYGLLRTPLDMTASELIADVPNVRDVRLVAGRVFFTAESARGVVFSVAP